MFQSVLGRLNKKNALKALMVAPPILFVAYVAHSAATIRELLSDSSSFHMDYANNLIQDYLSLEMALDVERLTNCLISGHSPCDQSTWVSEAPKGVRLQTLVLESGERHPVYLRPEELGSRLDAFFNRKRGLSELFTERQHEPVYWFQIISPEGEPIYQSSANPPEGKPKAVYEMTRSLKEHRLEILYNSFGPKQLYSVASKRINFGAIFFLFLLALLSVFLITRHIRQKITLARQKTFFVSTVSHEFKTPLAIMRLAAETLEGERYQSPEEARKFFTMLTNEINRLNHLVVKILSYNQIETDRVRHHAQKTDLRTILSASLEGFEVRARAENVSLNVSLGDEPCPIMADSDLIRHAIDNILDNAFKYRGDSDLIEVYCERLETEARLRVKDYGVGIADNEAPHIFKSFYRVDDAKIRGVRGSGLGLAISRHILKRAKAKLSLDSTPGQGSTFTIAFPLAKASA